MSPNRLYILIFLAYNKILNIIINCRPFSHLLFFICGFQINGKYCILNKATNMHIIVINCQEILSLNRYFILEYSHESSLVFFVYLRQICKSKIYLILIFIIVSIRPVKLVFYFSLLFLRGRIAIVQIFDH